ncbi:MAG: dTDP-4-dehydrorhamnose reductase [Magnetococcales bacterium]|nr:dTDP-4-dehydrorhamnose reductase [Magnetococcales bacterium]
MNILLTGCNGQLGWELRRTLPLGQDYTIHAVDIDQLDITDAVAVAEQMDRTQPQLVINTAAYTAVDRAEDDSDAADRVNHLGAAYLAREAVRVGARLIHISTDFVFDGQQSHPYQPHDSPKPMGVYGRTKLAGERAVLSATTGQALVIRTAWLYSAHGHNFPKTILRLLRQRPELGIVCDQVGTPTWARGLAQAIWRAVAQPQLTGVLHWSDAGACSWYDFAVAIQEEAEQCGVLAATGSTIKPIGSETYPLPASRPSYSVLDCRDSYRLLCMEPTHWRRALRQMMTTATAAELLVNI